MARQGRRRHGLHLNVAGLVQRRGLAPAAALQLRDLGIGVEAHRLPFREVGEHQPRLGQDADVADASEPLHGAGVERDVAVVEPVIERLPAAVETRHPPRVAPLHDEGADDPRLAGSQDRAELDHFVGRAADQDVEARLGHPDGVGVAGQMPVAEGAEAVARQVRGVQRHAVGEVIERSPHVGQHVVEPSGVGQQVRGLARASRHGAGRVVSGAERPAAGLQPDLARCREVVGEGRLVGAGGDRRPDHAALAAASDGDEGAHAER